MDEKKSNEKSNRSISDRDLKKLLDLIDTISYGSVTLVIQDSKVIQLEKNEKVRLRS